MRITWGDIRPYSQGVKQGVLFPNTGPGVPWNGLISVTVKGDDAASSLYIDGRRHRNRSSPSTFSGTISAFTYPDEFDSCIGVLSGWVMSQNKNPFGLTWRDNRELHIVYNAITSPSNDQYQTIGANVNPLTFSWDFTTTPVDIPAGGYSAHVVIMLDYVQPSALVPLQITKMELGRRMDPTRLYPYREVRLRLPARS